MLLRGLKFTGECVIFFDQASTPLVKTNISKRIKELVSVKEKCGRFAQQDEPPGLTRKLLFNHELSSIQPLVLNVKNKGWTTVAEEC